MLFWIGLWLCCAAVFLVADFLWLGVIAKKRYRTHIGHLLADRFRPAPAFLFYAVYVAGVLWFAVSGAESWLSAIRDGALFGFFCYGTYNLTNYATLRDWPRTLVFIDLSWGTSVTALTAAAGIWLDPYVRSAVG